MRFRTLEIRWHDSKPISTCDFQPMPSKKARPAAAAVDTNSMEWAEKWAEQKYRIATGGEDNHVRVWMVYPNIRPDIPLASTTSQSPHEPRVEYLATLSRHSAAVNVVRWSPNGELIASAGDDGMIIIWAPSTTPQATTYGSDLSAEELQNEKEYWRVRCMFRCTQMQVYDLAWSPNADYIITGSTDNVARVFQASDGKCVHEIAEHNHYVQGVSWDPLNEYIATQSSDKTMHVYRINTSHNMFEVHAVGRNRDIHLGAGRRSRRTPSIASEDGRGRQPTRPVVVRRESTATATSDVESALDDKSDGPALWSTASNSNVDAAPLTPATSVASTPAMFHPPAEKNLPQPSSRRSSFSGSNAPSSPAPSNFSRYRSPSPMPALPAIRTAAWLHASGKGSTSLYGDESYSNFFRRLTFSPDGGLLVTPAGQFEDPEVLIKDDEGVKRGRKLRPTLNTDFSEDDDGKGNTSCAYIYTRANFARPPVAQLPGHKKTSVAVRFNPVLFDLRSNVGGLDDGTPTGAVGKGVGTSGTLKVDVAESSGSTPSTFMDSTLLTSQRIAAPAPKRPNSFSIMASPALSPLDSTRPITPAASKPGTPIHVGNPSTTASLLRSPTPARTSSVFALPYRMLFAVVTMDAVLIYDTQQAGPICLLTRLHYDEFTDATWSPDGQCLMLSSRDGYCTLVVFDEILSPHQTQQQSIQLQSIAHSNSVPIDPSPTPARRSGSVSSRNGTPATTPGLANVSLPFASGSSGILQDSLVDEHSIFATPTKREKREREKEEPVAGPNTEEQAQQPPTKKKRRIALTRVGDVGGS